MQGLTSSYVITTLITAPDSALLTELATVKDELDIPTTDTSNDTRLTRFITEESAGIARYCNRIFGLSAWQDEFRPQRGVRGEGVQAQTNPLKLTRWPLTFTGVAFTGNTYSNETIDAIPSTAGLEVGMGVYGPGLSAGAVIDTVGANSLAISEAATATQVGVALTGGVSVTEIVAGVSTVLVPGTDFEVSTGSLLTGDEGTATLYRLNTLGHPRTWPSAQIIVQYQAGYGLPNDDYPEAVPTLPTDLESACIRLVVWRFKAKGRDPMLKARTQGANLGMEQYWVGATPGNHGPYPNEIMAILDAYRTPVVA